MRGRLLFVLFGAACLVATGCASGPTPHLSASAPSEDARASLGRIGIRSGPASPSGEWNMPAKGAAEGAKRGAYLGAASTLGGSGQAAILAPLGAAIGAVVGAAKAEPAEVVEEAEAVIKSVFAEVAIHDGLRDRVVRVTRAETRHTVVPQEDAATAAGADRPEPTDGGTDTSLQISVQCYGTKAARTPNPPVHLFVDTDVSLLRVADGSVLYSRRLTWVSPGRPITAWGVAKGEPVRQELERGIQDLAERIVDVIFLLRPFP
ncbi:MAG: hypothetical protein H6Q86_5006 [candidate division NC10 bacterium]|nr:hypothetical protein [candidate division NC10 bacterium]